MDRYPIYTKKGTDMRVLNQTKDERAGQNHLAPRSTTTSASPGTEGSATLQCSTPRSKYPPSFARTAAAHTSAWTLSPARSQTSTQTMGPTVGMMSKRLMMRTLNWLRQAVIAICWSARRTAGTQSHRPPVVSRIPPRLPTSNGD